MGDKKVIESLGISIRGYLRELMDAQDIDWEKFVKDNRSRRFVERLLQIAIEAMIDIGHHIISDEGFREPQNYRDPICWSLIFRSFTLKKGEFKCKLKKYLESV